VAAARLQLFTRGVAAELGPTTADDQSDAKPEAIRAAPVRTSLAATTWFAFHALGLS